MRFNAITDVLTPDAFAPTITGQANTVKFRIKQDPRRLLPVNNADLALLDKLV